MALYIEEDKYKLMNLLGSMKLMEKSFLNIGNAGGKTGLRKIAFSWTLI